jgi:hypothetical protein
LKADVSKAHRRIRVRRRDWGKQACRLDDTAKTWLNTVGTFGIASAGYYWSRLLAGAGRGLHYVLSRESIWQLIFSDDFAWTASGPDFELKLILTLLYYVVLGVPFSWHKTGGGLSYDWIGFQIDLRTFEVGLTRKRRQWLLEWIESAVKKK